ncbi:hypothetical protein [Streptosporangium pseudovulgare]|uniref:Uncharacterized protein n=1 Tax=Streptosporangium pseudovulgare TaxID=35765 RepID=A0ABQ2RI43_9ACTN|nr:hypothetical protein [Streptosporangium pseudovulgare]GGQ27448.1 hypothetical protein GCM10010140_67090 [Streptosporangium pseudovulgare]
MTALDVMTEFGSTGRIGPLRCGVSLTGIATVLGPPWAIGRVSKRTRWPYLFSYGHVELCVCRCRTVTTLSVQTWHDVVELPDVMTNTITPLPSRLTYRQITAALGAAGCLWQPVLRQSSGGAELRTRPLGVAFTFRTDDPESLLENAGMWLDTHDCPQISPGHPDDGFGA